MFSAQFNQWMIKMQSRKDLIRTTVVAFISLFILYVVCFFWIDKPIAFYMQETFSNTPLLKLCDAIQQIASPTHWLALGILSLIIAFIQKRKTL